MTSISKSDNMSALALRGLEKSSLAMGQAMERLSSGKRINRASDDSSGLSKASKMHAQTLGLNMSVRHANSGINILQTMEGSLSDQHNILQRMHELAVQSASDTNTGTDRTFIQDEINQLNSELNKISVNTEYNGIKLLDGTLNRKITVGSNAESQIIIDSQSTDSSTLGAFQLSSLVENSEVSQNDTHASAVLSVNDLIHDQADYIVKGSFETETAYVGTGASAKDVANSFDLLSDKTDITASAITKGRLKITGTDSYTFTLQGKSSNSSNIQFTINDIKNLNPLKEAINKVTSLTGISAVVSKDLSSVNITQSEGYNIIIADLTALSQNSGKNITLDLMDRNENLIGTTVLFDGDQVPADSSAIIGQVTLSSDKAFSVTSGHEKNHFSSDTNIQKSNFSSIGNLNLKTRNGATEALAIIDSALTTISRLHSLLGAKENHLLRAIDNLTKLSTATQKAKDQIEGADFASETSKLVTNQVLQKASTSMVTQASNTSKHLLQIINKE